MALFGSSEKKTQTSTKIRPTVMRVQNVAKELLAFAKSHSVKVEDIDFNILEIQTYTRMNDGAKETEWEKISQNEVKELDDASALLNPYFQIKQMYEIEFFAKKTENNLFENFHVAVGANATKCKIYLSIREGSSISYSPQVENEMITFINKYKIRAGILIGIFDEVLSDTVSKLIAHIRVEEDLVYTKNETLLIAESYEPTLTVNDALILHYDKEEEVDEHKKMDYSSRGFIKSVLKDEVLIEYIKAQPGKPGRNCRGEFIAPKEAQEKHVPTFKINETIKEVETPQSIKYIANENGYVTLEDNTYGIKTDVDLNAINFKTTGNITSGIDSDVNISVSEKDAIKDAVGMGMEVEVTEIDIEGNVGSNAKLKAIRASIDGQTHQSSEVRADTLTINVHKGKAYGKEVNITRLEHGIVEADNVAITQAIGGNIRAKKISIEICTSHVKATASQSIEIEKLQGSENVFTIDPLLKKLVQKSIDENAQAIKELKMEIRAIKKDVDAYSRKIKEATPAFIDLKKRLLHYKKSNIKMPESFIKKYKQFQQLQEQLKSHKQTYDFKNTQLEELHENTSSFQDNITDARIINRDGWRGYNELVFKLIDPPIDVSYKPAEGSLGRVFGLVEVDEGMFEIQALEE